MRSGINVYPKDSPAELAHFERPARVRLRRTYQRTMSEISRIVYFTSLPKWASSAGVLSSR
jgi:hypothetical protein